jgi:hypothetical protein
MTWTPPTPAQYRDMAEQMRQRSMEHHARADQAFGRQRSHLDPDFDYWTARGSSERRLASVAEDTARQLLAFASEAAELEAAS